MIRLQSRANGFPNQEDLNGAASALLRLQDTYDLPTTKIALGELGGVKTSPRLTRKLPSVRDRNKRIRVLDWMPSIVVYIILEMV